MNILAVDSCREGHFSVAIFKHGEIIFSRVIENRFSEAFFPLLRSEGKQNLEEIDLFTVNTGPGSYTGIRAAIAAIAGMSLHGKRKFIGFDSFSIVLDKFRRNSQKPLKPENTISVALEGYNSSFFYLKEFNGNFEEQTNPVRMPYDSLEVLCPDILLSNIQGCGDFYEILAEDLGLLASRETPSIKELLPIAPLYV